MTHPAEDLPKEGAENEKSRLDEELTANTTAVDLDVDPDDSKAHLINANGGAGSDHVDVKIIDGTAASSEGEVSFNGLGKDEVMKYADEPFWRRLRWILFILFWVGWLAMLVTAVVIIAVAPRCPPRPDLKWYQTETVYQVLPESFKDSNDDGIGDFDGLDPKVDDYIADDLDIKVVWLSNIYETDSLASELGILDHEATSASFGTTPDKMRSWMKSLRKEGKKVILDLVPNQSSKNHTWFQKSRNGDEKFKDFYVWKATTDGNPPNNWKTLDGDPAWTYDDVRKAYYFHQFGTDYPDLNLANEDVVEEIKDIMKFWFDKGVSGFHIKDVEYLVENPDLPDDDADRSQTVNYKGTFEFLEKLREVANQYSDKPGRERVLFATVYKANKNQTMSYWGTEDKKRLHIVLPLMDKFDEKCNANCVYDIVNSQLTDDTDQWLGLALGNQYTSRIASRIGAKTVNLHAAHALELLLPGSAFNYYGDEFGQLNGKVPAADRLAFNDDYRTPMQWNSGPNAGFTSEGVKPWLPIGADYVNNNRKAGDAHFTDGTTPLQAFKELVKLRGEESFQWGKTKLCSPNDNIFMFTRKATRFPYFLVMMNLGNQTMYESLETQKCVESKEEGVVSFHSRDEDQVGLTLNFHDNPARLAPGDVVVIEFTADD
ncbi:neutral and basic amino acid transport protein rBAT [Aplysia californica]|uniref:Neutral and basic amino acid transport protein rBAT n=1 Tax=Aplysia californica TaxID=6500 RepID=A0ABM0JQJ0_APLCA|nr:neutral and basic amino acid transport protein rBAT [Aplysia californica]